MCQYGHHGRRPTPRCCYRPNVIWKFQSFSRCNGRVRRIVMAAAAKYLKPVVLKLGGKSPVVDSGISLQVATRRIIAGKWGQNNGQASIVLVDESNLANFVGHPNYCVKRIFCETGIGVPMGLSLSEIGVSLFYIDFQGGAGRA